jgi:hypothetical protein
MSRGLLCLVVSLLSAVPVWAQRQPGEPIKLTLHPAGPPPRALKYQLLPELRDQTPGNAALYYYRAIAHRAEQARGPHFGEEESDWLAVPLKDFPREKARRFLNHFKNNVFREVALAARCERCDWQLSDRIREEGINLLLPDIQQMRYVANLLALRARLEIAEGHYDQALETLQTGFVLARHVSESPTLISSLVGIAIGFVMAGQLDELVQSPKAPNLYWALTDLPRPFIDLKRAFQGERVMIYGLFPELREARAAALSVREVQNLGDRFGQLLEHGGGTTGRLQAKLALIGLAAKIYPEGKRFLLDQGLPAEQVEAMPVAQVALLYMLHEYDRHFDDMIKWQSLPYWQARVGLEKAEQGLKEARANRQRMETVLATLLLPAVAKVNESTARIDRKIAALRCIEVIRLYAAAHDGRLPAELGAIAEVPIPLDPVTGKEFEYKVTDRKATLIGPVPPGAGKHLMLQYELTLER